jgi:hypothetical protein
MFKRPMFNSKMLERIALEIPQSTALGFRDIELRNRAVIRALYAA